LGARGLGYTPLHTAAQNGHIDIVKFFTLEKHCDPMLRDRDNNAALHIAVLQGRFEIVRFLIEELKCPLDIAGQDNQWIPFEMAVKTHHFDIARYLQEHSVIPYINTAILMLKQLGL